MDLFFTFSEEGTYNPTTAGYLLMAVLMLVAYTVGISFILKKQKFSIRQICFSAVAMALAVVTSHIKLWHMPMGGGVTLMSMLFIVLIGNWYGVGMGLCCGIAYGFLQMVLEPPYIISFPQAITDYILAFAALGLSGIFYKNKRQGLSIGYLFAIIIRFFFATLSGVMFFAEYAFDDSVPSALQGKPLLYSMGYNGSYIFTEALLTLVVINLPPVARALGEVKKLAFEGTAGRKEKKPEQVYDERRRGDDK